MPQPHSAAQALEHHGPPVHGELLARALAQLAEDLLQHRGFRRRQAILGVRFRDRGLSGAVADELFRDVADRQHHVDGAGVDGALRHAAVLGLVRILRDREASTFLDPADSEGPVRAGARQDHADSRFSVRLGQRTQEVIDGRTPGAPALELRQPQVRVDGVQIRIGRDHVDPVALECDGPHHLADRHLRVGLQHLYEVALMLR